MNMAVAVDPTARATSTLPSRFSALKTLTASMRRIIEAKARSNRGTWLAPSPSRHDRVTAATDSHDAMSALANAAPATEPVRLDFLGDTRGPVMTKPFLLVQLSDPHIGATWGRRDPMAALTAVIEAV